MSSSAQIDANQRNSQKSTGPRSSQGKAAMRFNALKTGMHAQSQVIPGEDAAELEALTEDYRRQFPPETPLELGLVEEIVAAHWQLRRLRTIEASLWREEMAEDSNLARAYCRNPALSEVQRRIDAAGRRYYRALQHIERVRKGEAKLQQTRMQGRKLEAKLEQARVKGQSELLNSAIRALSISELKRPKAAEPAPEVAPRKDGGS